MHVAVISIYLTIQNNNGAAFCIHNSSEDQINVKHN